VVSAAIEHWEARIETSAILTLEDVDKLIMYALRVSFAASVDADAVAAWKLIPPEARIRSF
jgi:phage baseplate assembly protein W